MGIYQPVTFERAEAFGPVGSRYGDGHRPSRTFRNTSPVAQVDSVTYVDNNDGTTLNVVVDGIRFEFLDTAGAGATALANLFINAINAHPTASQIVRAHLFAAGVMHLTARTPGTAFTATAGANAVGTSTATRAAVTANNAGQNIAAGNPAFRGSGGTDAMLARLPTGITDVFLGVVRHRHEDAELQTTPTGFAYPAGSIMPVDPNGMHVLMPETAVNPGDRVFVRFTGGTVGAWSNGSGQGAKVVRVTVTAATNTKLYSLVIEDVDGSTYTIEGTSDGSATVTEIRDLLGDRINFLAIPFTAADVSTDAIDITADVAANNFTVTEVDSELTQADQTAFGLILIENARWESRAAAGNKALMAHTVP